jgi:type II secretory pathway predicted ATPase ExeA
VHQRARPRRDHRRSGAGKTAALRAALASLDPSRHTLIYLPNPSAGVRGINHAVVAALERNRQLTEENSRLRQQLAHVLGDQRAARTRSGNNQHA